MPDNLPGPPEGPNTSGHGNRQPDAEPTTLPEGVEHGTRTAYNRHGCRCTDCKDAARDYRTGHVGGPLYTVANYRAGCRCTKCTKAYQHSQTMQGHPREVREPEHGTITRYSSQKWRCRCPECREASRVYKIAQREKKRTAEGKVKDKPLVWSDWSGVTGIVVCEMCGRNFGTWLSSAETAAAAEAHRRMHARVAVPYE